jgi:hypothetical protein
MAAKNSSSLVERDSYEVVPFSPVNPLPKGVRPMPFDLNEHLTADHIPAVNANYMSLERLELWLKGRDADARELTVTGVSMEWLYDPKVDPDGAEGEWKPCLSFAETSEMLVINITRRQQVEGIARSAIIMRWGEIGKVMLKPGLYNGKGQIGIFPAPAGDSDNGKANGAKSRIKARPDVVDAANDDLFG